MQGHGAFKVVFGGCLYFCGITVCESQKAMEPALKDFGPWARMGFGAQDCIGGV